MINGTIDTSEPVMTTENRAWSPAGRTRRLLLGEADRERIEARAVEHDQRQEVVVPGADQREQNTVTIPGPRRRSPTCQKMRNSPAPSTRPASIIESGMASAA